MHDGVGFAMILQVIQLAGSLLLLPAIAWIFLVERRLTKIETMIAEEQKMLARLPKRSTDYEA